MEILLSAVVILPSAVVTLSATPFNAVIVAFLASSVLMSAIEAATSVALAAASAVALIAAICSTNVLPEIEPILASKASTSSCAVFASATPLSACALAALIKSLIVPPAARDVSIA